MAQIADEKSATWQSNRESTTKAPAPAPARPPALSAKSQEHLARRFVEPMKCRPRAELPSGPEWLYELKFDGYRSLAICEKGEVLLLSRNRKVLNARFPGLVAEVKKLKVRSAILDGEIVALDKNNRPSFQVLQNYEQEPPLLYYFFDLLALDGRDWTGQPLERRREKLEELLRDVSPRLLFSGELPGSAKRVWQAIQAQHAEGVVAKRRQSHYETGERSGQWVKVKAINQQDFVIGGYTEPKGGRSHFGALLIGVYEQNGLRFCGKVGTGFNQKLLASLHAQMKKLKAGTCPFFNLPEASAGRWGGGITAAEMKRCSWTKPVLVAEVQFTEWTEDHSLRHPSFLGLRDDIPARDVHRETASA
jgi:bifunctional non-homologous end joining protein LigD